MLAPAPVNFCGGLLSGVSRGPTAVSERAAQQPRGADAQQPPGLLLFCACSRLEPRPPPSTSPRTLITQLGVDAQQLAGRTDSSLPSPLPFQQPFIMANPPPKVRRPANRRRPRQLHGQVRLQPGAAINQSGRAAQLTDAPRADSSRWRHRLPQGRLRGAKLPEFQYPSIVGRPILRTEEKGGSDLVIKDIMCGDEAAAARTMLQISYPMENGIVKKWDDMQHLWDYTFFEKMKVDPAAARSS